MAFGVTDYILGWPMMTNLLSVNDLPDGFTYPPEFVRVVELGLTRLEPWSILEGEPLHVRQGGITARYPSRRLVAFAERQDHDDVACFDTETDDVVIVHDFATPGWEQRRRFPDFNSWLKQALEDFIEFGGA